MMLFWGYDPQRWFYDDISSVSLLKLAISLFESLKSRTMLTMKKYELFHFVVKCHILANILIQ